MKSLTGFGFFKYNKGYKPTLNQFAGKVLLDWRTVALPSAKCKKQTQTNN